MNRCEMNQFEVIKASKLGTERHRGAGNEPGVEKQNAEEGDWTGFAIQKAGKN